jgi:Mg-chelatase subunit ChlD
MVENLETKGLTALGPALALALGVVSVHDIGSRIIIVSDEVPNKGILSPETTKINKEIFQKIGKII